MVGLQNFGENLRELDSAVSATVDIGEQYLVNVIEAPFGSTANPAVAGFNSVAPSLLVPQGEVWRLVAGNASAVTVVGGAMEYALAVKIGTGIMTLSETRTQGASLITTKAMTANPLWLPAGAEIGFYAATTAGGAGNLGVAQILINRLRA